MCIRDSKTTVDSPSPRWNCTVNCFEIYLPTTMHGLTKNSKNFQPLLRQVSHRNIILSDSLNIDIWCRSFHQEVICCLLEVSCPILNLIVPCPLDFALKSYAHNGSPYLTHPWTSESCIAKPLFRIAVWCVASDTKVINELWKLKEQKTLINKNVQLRESKAFTRWNWNWKQPIEPAHLLTLIIFNDVHVFSCMDTIQWYGYHQTLLCDPFMSAYWSTWIICGRSFSRRRVRDVEAIFTSLLRARLASSP